MLQARQGEQGQAPTSRSSRFFEQDNYWYYTTREGVSIGPFDHRADAEVGCSDFIEFISDAGKTFVKTLQQYGRNAA